MNFITVVYNGNFVTDLLQKKVQFKRLPIKYNDGDDEKCSLIIITVISLKQSFPIADA